MMREYESSEIQKEVFWALGQTAGLSPGNGCQRHKPKFLMARHVMSRHASSACILSQEKVVTCCVALVGQHGATRTSRLARLAHVSRGVATAWTGVDMSTSLFPKVVPEIDANPEHKRPCTREHYTASSSFAMLEQARHDTAVPTRSTCRTCRVETWCGKPSGIWAIVHSPVKGEGQLISISWAC